MRGGKAAPTVCFEGDLGTHQPCVDARLATMHHALAALIAYHSPILSTGDRPSYVSQHTRQVYMSGPGRA